MIGPVTTVIESFGSTSLVEVGNNYFLDSISSGSGPELKYAGAAVVTGQFGAAWVPIGAEQTASGYEVAWKATNADQYAIWNTNSSGNYVSNDFGILSGSSSALESQELTFHQDLNGDGVIGPATTAVQNMAAGEGQISGAADGITIVAASPSATLIGHIDGPGNDNFVFNAGAHVGADVIVNFNTNSDHIELDNFSLVAGAKQLQAFLNDAQTDQLQPLFEQANGGNDTLINFGNHDSITLANVHLADLHASNFIIH